MKKTIKETPKTTKPTSNKKNTRPFTTKDEGGYKEEVFNKEEQKDFDKTDLAKRDKRNTSGPK